MTLQVFRNDGFTAVRTVLIDGQVWFVGKDIADNLGYRKARNAIASHVDKDDALKQGVTDELGRLQETTLINESGLYSLILSSKLPTAKQFKRWVTSEILPSIRQHGLYAVDEVLANPDVLINALVALKAEREKTAIQQQQILELQPKATYYDVILQCEDAVPISVIAKDYGWSAQKLNQALNKLGIQYRQGQIWLLYQDYADKGYTCTKTFTYKKNKAKIHTYWTQKGRLFLYSLLKGEGILPTMEQSQVA